MVVVVVGTVAAETTAFDSAAVEVGRRRNWSAAETRAVVAEFEREKELLFVAGAVVGWRID